MCRLAVVVLCALLDTVFLAAGYRKGDSGLALNLLTESIPAEKLQCYQCKLNQNGCFNHTDVPHVPVVHCALNQPHCMVRRVEIHGRVAAFSRNCSSRCTPGCQRKAASVTCVSCCNTSRCNVDNNAASLFTRSCLTAIQTFVLAFVVFRSVVYLSRN